MEYEVPKSESWNDCAFCQTYKMTTRYKFDCLGCSNKPLCYECATEFTLKGEKLPPREKKKPRELELKNWLRK
jgi:hypothetical protein